MMNSIEDVFLFALAVGLLLLGHLIRATRWALLLGRNHRHELRARFTALAVGYVINAVIPFRVGELARALLFAQQTKSKLTWSIASVITERAYDLAAVALLTLLFFAVSMLSSQEALRIVIATVSIATSVFLAVYALSRFAFARKAVWFVADIFNERIRFVLLDTFMALIEIKQAVETAWALFLLQSLAMWAVYVASYVALGAAIHLDSATVMNFFFGDVFRPTIMEMVLQNKVAASLIGFYAFVPCILIILYVKLRQSTSLRFGTTLRWLTDPLLQLSRRTNERFGETTQYDAYLCRYFSGDASVDHDFETNAIHDATIIRRLGGGSEAITAVVEVGSEMRFRKFALNKAAQKLQEQYLWLEKYNRKLPLVRVFGGRELKDRFLYDMPYSISSRDFYEFIHTNTPERSWAILQNILNATRRLHESTRTGEADESVVRNYVQQKVLANFKVIQDSLSHIFEDATVNVNGKPISIERIKRFAVEDYLVSQITLRHTAAIHGDLTIENIIFDPDLPEHWMLIDPNGGNIFESPLLDYAKLFQSLHLGYESLNRNNPCSYSEEGIRFLMPRTIFYESLFNHLCAWIKTNFGDAAYREIRLHEIIHYFRLTPYKIRKAPHTGLLFFGGLCLLIDRYHDEFGTC